MILFLSVR